MNNNNFEITRSDYLYAIKFGTVDNTDFAVDFFRSVKEECGIEIVVCNYFEHREPVNEDNHSNNKKVHLQCHIMNPNNVELSELITEDTKRSILSIFDKTLNKHNVNLQFDEQTERRIIQIDFTYDARWFLIERSCTVVEKYLYGTFGFDAVVLAKHIECSVPTHIIAFKSAKNLEDFISNKCIGSLQERFQQYLKAKDHWNVLKNIPYSPILCFTSDLNEDQRYALARDRAISI